MSEPEHQARGDWPQWAKDRLADLAGWNYHDLVNRPPRLLTEAEWRKLLCVPLVEDALAIVRERGLIAPEPRDAIDRLRDSLEALHGIHLDRDKAKRLFEHAALRDAIEGEG